MKHKGHTITLTSSTLCGFAANKYEITVEGRVVAYGYHSGSREDAEQFAKWQVDQRLARMSDEAAQEGTN